MAVARIRGGHILKATIREALAASNVKSLKVGFFKSAHYPDGTPVAAVAAWNEFGTRRGGKQHVPERPFFRQALAKSKEGMNEVIRTNIDSKKLAVGPVLAGTIGAYVQGQVQKRITDLGDPPNAPRTIARKGSSNPLIDSGQMRQSVTWRVR